MSYQLLEVWQPGCEETLPCSEYHVKLGKCSQDDPKTRSLARDRDWLTMLLKTAALLLGLSSVSLHWVSACTVLEFTGAIFRN